MFPGAFAKRSKHKTKSRRTSETFAVMFRVRLSSSSDIADEDVVHAEMIDRSCVYVQDTIELLGIVRNLASETWLEEFLTLDD